MTPQKIDLTNTMATQIFKMETTSELTSAIHNQFEHFYNTLPDDVRENVKEVRLGWKFQPDENRTVSFLELIGR